MTCTSREPILRNSNLYRKQKSLLLFLSVTRVHGTSLDIAVQAKVCIASVQHFVFTTRQATVACEDDDSPEAVQREYFKNKTHNMLA